jgi:rod shape-determining protein MreC
MAIGSFAEGSVMAAINTVHSAAVSLAALPHLARENAALRARTIRLEEANARLREITARYAAQTSIRPVKDIYAGGIVASVIGFPPENEARAVTLDRGSSAGVRTNDGVVAPDGVVGRVQSVTPFSSQVILVTDYTSRLPAITRLGHYWGIARGNLNSVRVEYISQDAPIKVGEMVVTGRGESFPAGIPIGTITSIERSDTALYQTAILKPAVELGALDRVVVVPR